MKIYQLHKCGGIWEDTYDWIIGSYMRKERAEEEKAKAEAKEREQQEQSNKCEDCPYLYDSFLTNDELLSYCPIAQLEKDECGNVDCQNYMTHLYESYFRIEEVEVEE